MERYKYYKLSFPTLEDWNKVKPTLQDEIEGTEGKIQVWKAGLDVRVLGHIAYPATYKTDGEGMFVLDGNGEKIEETPARFHSDWAVNIQFDTKNKNGIEPEHLRKDILPSDKWPDVWYNAWPGENENNIVKPL